MKNIFRTKYRIVYEYTDGCISSIFVEYRRFFSPFWNPLKFNVSGAEIEFESGNLSLLGSIYDNKEVYATPEWWDKEASEIERIMNEYYINPKRINIEKRTTNLN